VEETSVEPLEPWTGHLDTLETQAQNPHAEMTNLELQATLLTIAWQLGNCPPKKLWVIKEPDPFSRGGPDKLHAFIFQCQIYFRTCEGEFTDNADKVFFAISYLQGIVLDYFEPFINEPDLSHNLDFLEDWSAFVQKLSNIFSSYSPEDNDKDTITPASKILAK